jgi:predicted Zn-ribbon and HTH transcriptional regulator
MSNIRTMIDAIAEENFNGAKGALKASLAEYMAGKKYVSNKDIFGDKYENPNDEEQDLKAELTEAQFGRFECQTCDNKFDDYEMIHGEKCCPKCKSSDIIDYEDED